MPPQFCAPAVFGALIYARFTYTIVYPMRRLSMVLALFFQRSNRTFLKNRENHKIKRVILAYFWAELHRLVRDLYWQNPKPVMCVYLSV